MKKKVIMIMGVQRSGTTVLFRSLARDPETSSFHESVDDNFYQLYRLRPVREIAPFLAAARGPVLLKPISETFYRSLEDVRTEYCDYALKLVWIYRDPVNVLHSMLRECWLASETDVEHAARSWVARNRLALKFCEKHPEQIAILRYEDLLADAEVFGALCDWLGMKGEPLFRADRAAGRRIFAPITQQMIDSLARTMLQALDATRRFRAGRVRQWQFAVRSGVSRFFPGESPRPVGSLARDNWKRQIAAARPISPNEFENLSFWFDAGRLSQLNGRVGPVKEHGPGRLTAAIDRPPPFCIPLIHGKPALFFPPGGATERADANCRPLRFALPQGAARPSLSRSFSAITLVRPQMPESRFANGQTMVILRICSASQDAEFILEWDAARAGPKAHLRTNGRSCAVEAPRGSQPNREWRALYFEGENEAGTTRLFLSCDGMSSEVRLPRSAFAQAPNADGGIELGGAQMTPNAFFYGAIAETIILSGTLVAAERFALGSYLQEKYRL